MKPHTRHIEYQRKIFSMRQSRDCVSGSDTIKRSGQIYLPMPSGMELVQPVSSTAAPSNKLSDRTLAITDAPWYHANPAYSAYVHRAKFPDMTANTLRGLVGISVKQLPEVDFPKTIDYLEDVATISGGSVFELFEETVSEIFQVGRHALVLDFRKDNTFYIAQYSSESYINWREEVIDGKRCQTYAEFETITVNENNEETKESLIYSLEETDEHKGKRVCVVYRFTDGNMNVDDGKTIPVFQGKPLERLPVENIGAEKNSPRPGSLPLIGVSDCALDIYRHSADLNQSQFMSCNPTLIFIGVDQDEAPAVVGSTVGICLSSPDSDAKYLTTDTSALSHVSDHMDKTFAEAVNYGAQLLGPTKRAVESAEALSLRQAASGATLVTIVYRVATAIESIIQTASDLSGSGKEVVFEPNIEFAESNLSAQEIAALLNAWMSGGISQTSFIESMAKAGYTGDRTAEEESDLIEEEMPVLPIEEKESGEDEDEKGKEKDGLPEK